MAFSDDADSSSAGFSEDHVKESYYKLLLFSGKHPDLLDSPDELGRRARLAACDFWIASNQLRNRNLQRFRRALDESELRVHRPPFVIIDSLARGFQPFGQFLLRQSVFLRTAAKR
jgi:hypothetical protein